MGERRTGLGCAASVALAVVALVAGCASGTTPDSSPSSSAPSGTAASAYPEDDELRLNQIQVLGSHNSYHLEQEPDVRAAIDRMVPGLTGQWAYEHPPLPEQFSDHGVRQIELDVFADPVGGRWATRHVLAAVGRPTASGDPELDRPGFKVQHVQELDFRSTCVSFVICLRQVDQWSRSHPGHVPLAVLVEAKDSPVIPDLGLGIVAPLPIGAAELDAVDAEIRSVFDPDRLITPDVVRGTQPTLDAAVRSGTGWPTLGESRGKVMFLLDNGGLRDTYGAGHPSLAGRVMFTDAEPGTPEAAFVKRNGAIEDQAEIAALVRQGYVVRTRSDGDTTEARSGDTTARDAAFASGAQWISTDYEVADTRFGHGFVVAVPGGTPARCNPVTAPPGCTPADIESPAHLTTR